MFKFFSTKKIEEPIDDTLASISYVVKRGKDSPYIDVLIHDYDDECIEALCSLLSVLGDDMFFIDTVNIIKALLLEQNRTDILVKIISQIHTQIRNKGNKIKENQVKDYPCVKPSEMFKT